MYKKYIGISTCINIISIKDVLYIVNIGIFIGELSEKITIFFNHTHEIALAHESFF